MIKLNTGIIIALLSFCLFAPTVWAQLDCNTLRHWVTLDNNLKLNQKHVFCGEWDRNRPKGFHSRPDGVNPDTVGDFAVQDKANAAGVYTGRWSYQGRRSKNKFSSMFPDNCTADQIVNSITYAIDNPAKCPAGSPNWTQCGPNKPGSTNYAADDNAKFCSMNDRFFTIGFAPPRNGKVNTAFPFYE